MDEEVLYHGTKGINILSIINMGEIRPGNDHKIFFGRFDWQPVLFHGADGDLGASFAVKLLVHIPHDILQSRQPTQGVRSSLILVTNKPLKVKVLELFVREPRAESVLRVLGDVAIQSYLEGRIAEKRPAS